MTLEELKLLVRDVPDFPKAGILFKDITPLLSDAKAFRSVIRLMAAEADVFKPTKLVGIESRGFIFGAAMAQEMGLGLVLIRKKGKLPWKTARQSYQLEYGSDEIEIHQDALTASDRVIVVDDVLATGGTALSSIRLCEQLGAKVEALLTFIELEFLKGRAVLSPTPVRSILRI